MKRLVMMFRRGNAVRLVAGPVALVIGAALLVSACSDKEAAKQQHLENGKKLLAEKKPQDAIIELRNAVQIDPRFGQARYQLAEAYEASGNIGGALQEYVRAADLLPTDNIVQTKAATYLVISGRYEDAKTRIQRVLDHDPTNVDALIVHGNALAALKDLSGALKEVQEAIDLDPKRAASYSNLAVLKLAEGDREQAKAAFEKAVAVDPQSLNARLALANFQWGAGDMAGAEQSLKRALEIDSKNALANQALATFYMGSGRMGEAEPYLKAAVDIAGTPQAQIQLADYYLAGNRIDDAKRVLTPLVDKKETAAEAQARLAAIAYSAGDKAGATKMIDDLLARVPSHVPSLLLKARWLAADGKIAEAAVPAQNAVKSDPSSVRAQFLLGVIQTSLQQNEQAIASFNEVLKLNPRAAAAQLYLSRLHLAGGASDTALQFAEAALKNAPGNPDARASLVRGLISSKDFGRAETELGSLQKQYPNATQVFALEGALKLQKGDLPGARTAYERALKLAPDSREVLTGLTMVDIRQNRAADARQRIDAKLAATPNRVDLMLLSAQISAAQQKMPEAEATLRKAIQIDPTSLQAYGMLAVALVNQGKLDDARAEFDGIAQRDPKNIGAMTMSAMILDRQGKTAESQKRYEQIVAAQPRAAIAANNLAWLYAEAGEKLDDALRLAQSAAAVLPENAEVNDTIGWIYYKKEQPSMAIPAFEKSVSLAPENASYHYHLALAHSKNGDMAKARQAAEQALKIQPNYPEAQKFIASIK